MAGEIKAEQGDASLILSPMLVETGAPALISNLDLGGMRKRGPDAPPGSSPDETSAEIFRDFRGANKTCKLSTAVRLNATFPFVTPAVSLPYEPERRPVDAGYYDGHGVDVATDYLVANVEALKETRGVVLIQVRAFPADHPTPSIGHVQRALQFLTSPMEGLSAARSSSQIFRNDQDLDAVARILEHKGIKFNVITLEASVDVSMSWYTRDDEMEALRGQLVPVKDENGKIMPPKDVRSEVDAKFCGYPGVGDYITKLQKGDLEARRSQSRIHRAVIANEFERLRELLRCVPTDTKTQQ